MAASVHANPRSSHMSSGEKMFSCPEVGCGKSFARREHLHRHEFNHKDSDFTCPRCSAHFRRRDLLERHKLRHQQKDDEAGGEGLGHLATRKRLWKDNDGKVVKASRRIRDAAGSLQPNQTDDNRPDTVEHNALPSPPISWPSSSNEQRITEHEHAISSLQEPWQVMDLGIAHTYEAPDPDFLSTSSWIDQSLQTFMKAPCDLPYNDPSYPDTTISFSTSLPTSSYYSWLFGNEFGFHHKGHAQQSYATSFESPDTESAYSTHDSTIHSPHGCSDLSPERRLLVSSRKDQSDGTISFGRHNGLQPHSVRVQSPGLEASDVRNGCSRTRSSLPTQGTPDHQSSRDDMGSSFGPIGVDSTSLLLASRTPPSDVEQITSPSLDSSFCSLPDTYTWTRATKLPIITNTARDGLMQLISQARPTRPDKSEITSSDALLSLESLQRYSDLFFTRFNSTYPLIHAPTFRSSTAHPLQLMAIILLGATHCDKAAHLLAVCIHDIMRPLIHSSKEFGPRPKLWMLQTILLVDCFGKSRAGERQHDMSNIYHGLQINLLRRSDCLGAYIPSWDATSQSLEEYWHLAIEAEEKRRLALISFMWDTQHALFFAQILCMNASELKLTLPWDPAVWAADTADEWLRLTQSLPPSPQFLTALQKYTDPSASSAPLHLNALSRVLVLHGLMSLSWDFRRRDQTALNRSIIPPGARWQSKISACYTKWSQDFDLYTKKVLTAIPATCTHHSRFQKFMVANSAIYHTAQLILQVEIADLQIQAGAKHIMGRPLTEIDRQRSETRLDELVSREEGRDMGRAIWHAARLLRDGIRKLDNWDVDDMFHYPWCLYLSTLACWTLHSIVTRNNSREIQKPTSTTEGYAEDDDSDWDSKTDMKVLISALTRLDPRGLTFAADICSIGAKYKPYGLLRCIKKYLGTIRWAVIREGIAVLQDLLSAKSV